MKIIKAIAVKIFCSLIIASDSNSDWIYRIKHFFITLSMLSPIAFLIGVVEKWYMSNQLFVILLVIFLSINMGFGGWIHFKRGKFNFSEFLDKTSKMILSVSLVYLSIEAILLIGGSNAVTDGFRLALQITTLLFPISKILKNVFIYTNGEYPPQWIMQKVYNFQENGDLKEFLSTTANHLKKDNDEEI